jgi:hypothetical protein
LLPPEMELRSAVGGQAVLEPDGGFDATWELRDNDSGTYTNLVVEAKREVTPRAVTSMLARTAALVRQLSPNTGLLVVTPWLSPRAQEALVNAEISFLDLTGNVRLRLRRPSVYIRTTGAARSPAPVSSSTSKLTGARANRLIRCLVDAVPPFRAKDLVDVTGLSAGYVSRALEALDEQALIQREPRGEIRDVDWVALLRYRALSYDLFRSNAATSYVAQGGLEQTLQTLQDQDLGGGLAVTGAFAAASLAAVTAPEQLLLYAADERIAARARKYLRLLPTPRGGNVVLLSPADPSHLWGLDASAAPPRAAWSQVVLDCLSGNGRLPQDGEALLEQLRQTEWQWRASSLDELGWPGP